MRISRASVRRVSLSMETEPTERGVAGKGASCRGVVEEVYDCADREGAIMGWMGQVEKAGGFGGE